MSQSVENSLKKTRIVIRPLGISGIYNERIHVLSAVFTAEYVSGDIRIQPEEILEARYLDIDEINVSDYVKRPHIKSRILDAINTENPVPYETWDLNAPNYKLLTRLDGRIKDFVSDSKKALTSYNTVLCEPVKCRNLLSHKAFRRHSTTSFFSLCLRITLLFPAKIYEPDTYGLYAEKDIRT